MNESQPGVEKMAVNTAQIMEMVWATLRATGAKPDKIVVNRLAMTIAMDNIINPYARAKMLFNAGHRGPWHKGFWRK